MSAPKTQIRRIRSSPPGTQLSTSGLPASSTRWLCCPLPSSRDLPGRPQHRTPPPPLHVDAQAFLPPKKLLFQKGLGKRDKRGHPPTDGHTDGSWRPAGGWGLERAVSATVSPSASPIGAERCLRATLFGPGKAATWRMGSEANGSRLRPQPCPRGLRQCSPPPTLVCRDEECERPLCPQVPHQAQAVTTRLRQASRTRVGPRAAGGS